MVSMATIQPKVDRGFAVAADKLGVTCRWYRPTGPINPLASGNLLGTMQVLFDTNADMQQRQPRRRQKPDDWYGAFNTADLRIGDYLMTPTPETFFVTTLDPYRPSRLVLCNRIVDIHAPGTMPALGFNPGYGGDNRTDEAVVISGWPASLIKGPRGEAGDVKLPGDAKLPWEEMLLPAIPGAALRNDMILSYTSSEGVFRLVLVLVELTSLGYRCTAVMETT